MQGSSCQLLFRGFRHMYSKYILTANDGKPVAEKCVWFYIYVSVSGHVCDFVFIQYVGYVCMTIHECRQERRTGGQVQPGLESFIIHCSSVKRRGHLPALMCDADTQFIIISTTVSCQRSLHEHKCFMQILRVNYRQC